MGKLGFSWLGPAVLGALLCCVPSLQAQQTPALTPGARVRMQVPALGDTVLKGRFSWYDGSMLTILVGPDQSRPLTVSTHEIRRLEVLLDRDVGGSVLRGAGIGLLAGAVVGAVIGAASYSESGFVGPSSPGEGALVGAFGFGVLGLPIGALVGLISPRERWAIVSFDAVPTTGGPASGVSGAGGLRVELRIGH